MAGPGAPIRDGGAVADVAVRCAAVGVVVGRGVGVGAGDVPAVADDADVAAAGGVVAVGGGADGNGGVGDKRLKSPRSPQWSADRNPLPF